MSTAFSFVPSCDSSYHCHPKTTPILSPNSFIELSLSLSLSLCICGLHFCLLLPECPSSFFSTGHSCHLYFPFNMIQLNNQSLSILSLMKYTEDIMTINIVYRTKCQETAHGHHQKGNEGKAK